jgi:O-antigen/teichoic acid export membrane protein
VQLLLRGFIFRVIFTVIGFLISMLIAKLAGASQFGTLSLIIVNAALIHIITGLGTDAAIVWHGVAGTNYDRNKIFSFTLITATIQLLFFYIIAILGYLFLGQTLLGGSLDLRVFFAEIVYFTGLVLMDKFLSLYYSQHEARLCNKILSIVSGLLFLVVLIVWLIKPIYIVDFPIWIYSLFVFIPSFILAFFFIIKFNPAFKNVSQEEMRSFSSFSFVVLITNLIQFVAFRADYWLISIYYDHTSLGVFAQASKFVQLLWVIPSIFTGLITPALKKENEKLTTEGLVSICRIMVFTHLILGFLLISLSAIIYKFFLPDVYYKGFFSLLIMLPGYLVYIVNIILAAYFSANRLLWVNLYGSILCCALMLLFDFLLIPRLNYIGAGIANLLTYSITIIFIIFQAKKFIKVAFKDFFIIKRSDFNIFSNKIMNTNI